MKNTIQRSVLILIFHLSYSSFGQGIEIKDLELPNAPALTLLDESTTELETPTNVQALTLSLVNNINNNFAFEVNPYMFFSKDKNFYKFNNFEAKGGSLVHKPVFYSLFKDLSVSLAKVKKEDSQNLSIGLRTNLIRYEQKSYVDNFIAADTYFTGTYLAHKTPNNAEIFMFISLKNALSPKAFQILFEEMPDGNLAEFDDTSKIAATKLKYQIKDADYDTVMAQDNTNTEAFSHIIARFKQYKTLKDSSDLELKHYNDLMKALNDDRPKPVFTLDFASGYSHFFDSSDFSGGRAGKFGSWLTANANAPLGGSYLSFFLYGRYLLDDSNFEASTNSYTHIEDFDLGGKVEFEYRKLSFAYEYINRTKQKENYRSVGTIKVKFNDYITVNGGFGKNFEATDNLVTFLGVSWGLEHGNSFSTPQ